MKLRSIALAAIATVSFGAQAALMTYAPWDTYYPDVNGLDGVLFNVQTAEGVTVALGAHGYKNGVSLPNDGDDTFYANSGIYPDEPSKNYANWSFDFAWNLGTNCQGCVVTLKVDKDPSAGVNFVNLFSTNAVPPSYFQSWNMEMSFMTGSVYDFNPNAPSSTAFMLEVTRATGGKVVGSDITVSVPEPGTIALLGLALAGVGVMRRRQAKA